VEIVAKTVAPNRLGSYFANREFWGALGAVGCGFAVKWILGSELPFPGNYVLLFALSLGFFVPGWIAFASVKEPPSPAVEAQSPRAFAGSMLACLRTHREFRQLLTSRVLLGGSAIALPFYILYGREVLHLPTSAVGTYISLQMAGAMSANLVWGRLNDRRSPYAVIVAVTLLSLLGPGVALLATLLPLPQAASRIALGVVFFALGATGGGAFIGYTNYLLAIAPEARRPLYVGILNTLAAIPMCLPALGGVIISYTSYRLLFALAFGFTLAGVSLAIRLPPCPAAGSRPDV
jgi:predicted MFS family arabinose efflux permease